MSEILNTPQQITTASGFQFSAASLNDLDSSEYSLVTIVVDSSGSVTGFKNDLEKCVKTVLRSLVNAPRAENLLVRYITFDTSIREVFGFRLLDQINLDEINGSVHPGGGTNLYDAVQSAVEATYDYGKLLAENYYVNGITYVITDGGEGGGSRCTTVGLKNYMEQKALDEEGLESMNVILIGVGYGGCAPYLDKFKNESNLTQFVDMEKLFKEASPEKALAVLAGLVTNSVSVVSQSLQNGTSPQSSALLAF